MKQKLGDVQCVLITPLINYFSWHIQFETNSKQKMLKSLTIWPVQPSLNFQKLRRQENKQHTPPSTILSPPILNYFRQLNLNVECETVIPL